MKRIFKYATGDTIPGGAIFLSTVTNGVKKDSTKDENKQNVWHYFLVEVDEEE